MPFSKKSGDYGDTGDRQQRMFMEKTNKKKSPMKRKPTSTAMDQDTRSRLRGTTGGGKPDVNPAYKKGGMMKKKGYAMGGMMKKKGYAKGGKVRGSGIARQGVRAAKMM